jgi:hypothetical protein
LQIGGLEANDMADESEYPYTTVPNRLRGILGKIPDIGRPDKATQEWLKTIGYTSSNDRSCLSVMRKTGVIAAGGEPTPFWVAIRSRDRQKVGQHVRIAYRGLFDTYPHADKQDDEALRTFFRSKTGGGEVVQTLMVRTFKVFVEFGDFSSAEPDGGVDPTDEKPPEDESKKVHGRSARAPQAGSVALTVNIQLQLPPSTDGKVYDELFAAMARHLKGLIAPE